MEESTSKPIWVVVRIHFIEDMGLRSAYSCFSQGPLLGLRGHPQFLATQIPSSTLPQIKDHFFKASRSTSHCPLLRQPYIT